MGALFVALLLVLQDVPSNWIRISVSGTSTTYVDYSTIKSTGAHTRTAWLRRQYDQPIGQGASYEVAKLTFDCAEETSGILAITAYSATGAVINFSTYKPSEVNMTPQSPGSLGLATLQAVCKADR